MSPNPPQLLIELLELIFDNHIDDTQALATCSLVCRLWSSIARRRLFREVRSGSRASSTGAPAKARSAPLLCDRSSGALPYVRGIHLSADEHPRARMREADRAAHNRILDGILREMRVEGLTALESLRIDYLMWSVLSAPSRDALRRLSQRIVSLHLDYPYSENVTLRPLPRSVVPRLLCVSRTLRRFTLFIPVSTRVEVEEEEEEDTWTSSQEKLVLDSLGITDESATYLTCLHSFFPAILLKHLFLGAIHEGAMRPILRFLRSCTTTLESLSLELSQHSDGRKEAALVHTQGGFPTMPALRALKLSGISILSAPALLRAVRAPSLADLTIATGRATSACEVPSDLADSLSTGTFAITWPRVTFVYQCPSTGDHTLEMARDRYIAALPVLHREGRLRIVQKTA